MVQARGRRAAVALKRAALVRRVVVSVNLWVVEVVVTKVVVTQVEEGAAALWGLSWVREVEEA